MSRGTIIVPFINLRTIFEKLVMDRTEKNQVLIPERLKSLEIWLQQTHMKLIQVNGQRRYGGPPDVWHGDPPGSGCEIFISQIPRDVYEDRLIPLFSAVGPLWEFRLMMNFSGQNRGFAYAKYGSPALAAAAIRSLHGHALEPGVRLSVRRSTEKRQLLLGELPTNTSRELLLQALRDFTEGVKCVTLKSSLGEEGVSADVVYSSHHLASMAKKVLVEAFKKRFGFSISVKWLTSTKSKPKTPPRVPKTPPSPFKLPHRTFNNSPHLPLLPPRLIRPPLPPGFSRAVGSPAHLAPPPTPPSLLPRQEQGRVDAVRLLQQLCMASGGRPPLFELLYQNTAPDGFLRFSYRVCVPGLGVPFTGMVQTLPGPSATAMQEEAQRAAAEQVIRALRRV
ncbi:dead end protein 1 [Hypomesus transpacificus]|uniref:dead end protein 1 n=1 Tax=Hypomesus transpacificus TaxID=137520 RepID=UPI001F088209|nr:dead end protein 1 [Hypomesus transpacificus]